MHTERKGARAMPPCLALLLCAAGFTARADTPPPVHFRANQAGYRPDDRKRVVLFSERPLRRRLVVADAATGKEVARLALRPAPASRWGRFGHHYLVDLESVRAEGRYRARLEAAGPSFEIAVSTAAYGTLADELLDFMRQQRCGYNPYVGEVCHALDGRTAYGPEPAGSYLDARGGWHDAGDQLKYLLTSSTATAHLLLAWRAAPHLFGDTHDGLGRPGANGRADVLDEARWGLEWMLRLHPAPDQLYHQVADDRDHVGWKLPHQETSDYGWGKGGYRVVYFADGRPQGLGRYPSASDGIANLAGRYAAAMALAHAVFKEDPRQASLAARCLEAAVEVYRIGRAREGVQQGNSYGAPYRYAEATWADDMEWGAAELYRATGEPAYLEDALRYARKIGATSWLGREAAGHYELYPFLNYGHYALHASVSPAARRELEGFYREGLEAAARRAAGNPWGVGVPFLWCSNNLVVALATQALLYESMSGDTRYRALAAAQLDWLLGANPWGVSMFTELPRHGRFPTDVHLSTTRLTGRRVRGGLVDGPVPRAVFEGLKGATLSRPDVYADFQADEAVYHDDAADYATNEPTLDGTASAILLFALIGRR
jgi:hypothetical protein